MLCAIYFINFFSTLLKHCIWLNKQQLFQYTKDLPSDFKKIEVYKTA